MKIDLCYVTQFRKEEKKEEPKRDRSNLFRLSKQKNSSRAVSNLMPRWECEGVPSPALRLNIRKLSGIVNPVS